MKSKRQETASIVRHCMDGVVVRDAYPDDDVALRRLASVDDRPGLRGHVVLAELNGELVAATSVSNGRSIADPWRPTADIVALLELRAAQIRRAATGSGAAQTYAASPSLRPLPASL